MLSRYTRLNQLFVVWPKWPNHILFDPSSSMTPCAGVVWPNFKASLAQKPEPITVYWMMMNGRELTDIMMEWDRSTHTHTRHTTNERIRDAKEECQSLHPSTGEIGNSKRRKYNLVKSIFFCSAGLLVGALDLPSSSSTYRLGLSIRENCLPPHPHGILSGYI